MTRIFVSIAESTPERALDAIQRITDGRVGIELRVDCFDPAGERRLDLSTFRSATTLPMLYTRRSGVGRKELSREELNAALQAGFDLIDLEADGRIANEAFPRELDRIVLSHHDYDAVPALDGIIAQLVSSGARHVKLAVTPRSFGEDRLLLARLMKRGNPSNLSLFGMGTSALYSRTLAPFLGSELSFVSVDDSSGAAPGQFSMERALGMWDPIPESPPKFLFAVVGNPAKHSRSPMIHNGRFRAADVPAAYGIIETESLAPVLEAMARGRRCAPTGISVTAPFKLDLFEEGGRLGWTISERAARVGTANTLVRLAGRFLIDNTDILGFSRALRASPSGSKVAIIGAGSTARAAAFASRDRGHDISIYNRTKGKAESLAAAIHGRGGGFQHLGSETFDVMIDTLPGDAPFDLPIERLRDGGLLILASYQRSADFDSRARQRGIEIFSGLQLLEAQAEEQSRRFVEAAGGTS